MVDAASVPERYPNLELFRMERVTQMIGVGKCLAGRGQAQANVELIRQRMFEVLYDLHQHIDKQTAYIQPYINIYDKIFQTYD